MTKEELIAKVVTKEWKMFENVRADGGRTACQDDPVTFGIMRSCQGMSWAESTLESYVDDLSRAEEDKRNLLMEKYARMMESTSPSEYADIRHLLPELEMGIPQLIDKITDIVLAWTEDLSNKYPYVHKLGRPIHSYEDGSALVSIETYLRAELATYSRRTLQLYYESVLRQQAEKINGSEITLECTVRRYGYSSLQDANEKLKAAAGWSIFEENHEQVPNS
jgi:hypothetical protein